MVQVGEKRNLMKYFYPAIFTLDRKKNEFRAVFPDLTGCAVKAESMAEAARKGYGCVPRISRISDGTGGIGFC